MLDEYLADDPEEIAAANRARAAAAERQFLAEEAAPGYAQQNIEDHTGRGVQELLGRVPLAIQGIFPDDPELEEAYGLATDPPPVSMDVLNLLAEAWGRDPGDLAEELMRASDPTRAGLGPLSYRVDDPLVPRADLNPQNAPTPTPPAPAPVPMQAQGLDPIGGGSEGVPGPLTEGLVNEP